MFRNPKLLCGLVSLLVAVRSSCNKKTRGLRDDGAATRRGTGLRMLSDCTHKPEITPTARFRHWGTHTGPAPSTRPRAWRAPVGGGGFNAHGGGWGGPRPSDSPETQGLVEEAHDATRRSRSRPQDRTPRSPVNPWNARTAFRREPLAKIFPAAPFWSQHDRNDPNTRIWPPLYKPHHQKTASRTPCGLHIMQWPPATQG